MAQHYKIENWKDQKWYPKLMKRVKWILKYSSGNASSDVFGDQTDRAIKHLAAHIIAIQLAQMGIQIGATEGKVYGKGLNATQYGQEFKRMLETVAGASSIGFVV